MIRINPLHPLFAAEVTGLDLTRSPSSATFDGIRQAFARYSVLVFRDQCITDDQQIAFSSRFGPLETTIVGTTGTGSKLVVLSNMTEDGAIRPPDDAQVRNGRTTRQWHADSTFKENPARASMLSGRVVPSKGGDTEFASMRAAYAELPDEVKARIDGLVTVHHYAYGRDRLDPELTTQAERDALPPVRQAMVLDHGRHGKSLYLGAHCASVEGLSEAEGRELIDELMAFATRDRFVFRQHWQPHDMVLWDNRAVMHRGRPYDSAREKRMMVRTTIAGDGSTAPPPA